MMSFSGLLTTWEGTDVEGEAQQRHFRGLNEVADFFKVSTDTVREWRKAGAPFILIGKKWQASYDDIWEWLKNENSKNPVK